MKKFISIIMMMCAVFIGCEKQNNDPESIPRTAAFDCMPVSFLEGVSNNMETSYLVKGIVLDKIEYGVSVKLIEDLKGNFNKSEDVFTVWGDGDLFIESNRVEKMSLYYEKGDTLIMHITHSPDWSEIAPSGYVWLEKTEDYCTITCTPSVIKLSDGYATGYILPEPEPVDKLFIEKLPIDDFQKRLNEALN